MPNKNYQTKLDEGPLELREATGVWLSKILNWNPRLSIRLQFRAPKSFRPQFRFWCLDEKTAKTVIRVLGLTTRIELHKERWFRVMITKRSVVQEVLGALLCHLAGYAYTRAELLLEGLGILDSWKGKMSSVDFPPARLIEIVELLE